MPYKKPINSLALLLIIASSYLWADTGAPRRIISMAPNTTEILFALGVGDRLVGVTRYCDYPAAATKIRKVGGFVDPHYEAIVALRPDLTVLISAHRMLERELSKLRLRTVMTPHEQIDDVHQAITLLGAATGADSAPLLLELERRRQAVAAAIAGRERPRVLLILGLDSGSDRLSSLYAAGRGGFHHELIELAGGENAYRGGRIAYPQLSAEGLLALQPEVIIDLVERLPAEAGSARPYRRQWEQLPMLRALRERRIHTVVGSHALRPGPRYIDFLEQLARLLHPAGFPATASE